MHLEKVGISGFTAYVPPYRVDLRDWCDWTGNNWDKVSTVVGTGFRMMGPGQSIYTLAATAALRLIDRYDIDPHRIRFLGLGTESSTDNSAGAVIVKGMLDSVLRERGLGGLNRHCEVPEVKHACLGGVYAMKQALRFLATEPDDPVAIVISADVAKYDLGCTGEPTQGAGAVAVLLEKNPRILEVDLTACGSASDYRAVDFRKPMYRPGNEKLVGEYRDTPVFNGKYSTSCYMDETAQALKDMLRKLNRSPSEYYRSLKAVFMHRPYDRMPVNSLAFSYLCGLANDEEAGHDELAGYCRAAEIPVSEVIAEIRSTPDILGMALQGGIELDPYPQTMALLKEFRKSAGFKALMLAKMTLGKPHVMELGNLYSASLPAWIAAGLVEAEADGAELAGEEILAVGYGSGDAAEAIPMRVAPDWKDASRLIDFAAAMEPCVNLTQDQYVLLHSTGCCDSLDVPPSEEFVVARIGDGKSPDLSDEGVEYYRYVGDEEAVDQIFPASVAV